MRAIGYFWGIFGVIFLLAFAIFRLSPMAFELASLPLSAGHWAALVLSVSYMAYAEGYKGFHLAFAPRVVARAAYLRDNPSFLSVVLAPLFCMGYFHATRKRQIVAFALTGMIIVFVIVARQLPQPWRGILDAGVVVGLSLGIVSILYFLARHLSDASAIAISPDVPANVEAQGSHA